MTPEKVLKEVMDASDLKGHETLIVGDGPVEIRKAKRYGCVALGVASDEALGWGWNGEKRRRLLKAGADVLVPAELVGRVVLIRRARGSRSD